MRRMLSLLTVVAAVGILGACGGTDVAVQAQARGLTGGADAAEDGPTALTGLEVKLLPYDRDMLFDSLAQVAAEPEPQIPDTLMQLQEQIAEANIEYQQATARWNTVRDSLKTLSDELNQLSPASPQYRVLFGDFNDLESRVNSLETNMNQSFERFSELQRRFSNQAETIRLQRAQWGDEAFRSVDSIIDARLTAMGLEEYTDTTDASGSVVFRSVEDGQWWAHARYELPYEELYWNVPVQVEGDQVELTLNRDNADSRPKL